MYEPSVSYLFFSSRKRDEKRIASAK